LGDVDDSLEHLFLLLAARILEEDPDAPFEKLRADVSKSLVSAGVSGDLVAKLCDKHVNFANVFDFKGIINPKYLEEVTSKKLFFYIIDASHGRHGALRQLVRRWEGDLSRYVVYGTEDMILRLHGTDNEAASIHETLRDADFSPCVFEVEKVHYYYGYRVKPHLSMKEIPENNLNMLASNWRSKDIPDQVKKKLLDKKILLGSFALENLEQTHRIKAFVGVTLAGLVPYHFKLRLPDHLLRISEIQSCLLSMYECKKGPYDFVLELLASDTKELDTATDKMILSYSGDRGRVYHATFIVAKADEKIPVLSRKESLVVPSPKPSIDRSKEEHKPKKALGIKKWLEGPSD